MASLIENVVSLEVQAGKTVEAAHAQAKEIENGVKSELRRHQAALEEDTTRRVEAFRAEAEVRYQEELEKAKRDFEKACSRIEGLDDARIRRQVDRVLARFREL